MRSAAMMADGVIGRGGVGRGRVVRWKQRRAYRTGLGSGVRGDCVGGFRGGEGMGKVWGGGFVGLLHLFDGKGEEEGLGYLSGKCIVYM